MHGVTCHYEYRTQQMHLKYLHAFRCNSHLIHINQAPVSIPASVVFVSSMLLFKSLPERTPARKMMSSPLYLKPKDTKSLLTK